jgi:hypothetical protein
MKTPDRIVDEMALVLLEIAEPGNDVECILALKSRGYLALEIYYHLDEAREIARAVRNDESDLWSRLMEMDLEERRASER